MTNRCFVCGRLKPMGVTPICNSCSEALNRHGYVQVIRCKDCKNACVYDDDDVICTHIDSNGNDKHSADWYCADGVRKDG